MGTGFLHIASITLLHLPTAFHVIYLSQHSIQYKQYPGVRDLGHKPLPQNQQCYRTSSNDLKVPIIITIRLALSLVSESS